MVFQLTSKYDYFPSKKMKKNYTSKLTLTFPWGILRTLSFLVFFFHFTSLVFSAELILDLPSFEKAVLAHSPLLSEDSLVLSKANNNLQRTQWGALLPKLEFQMALGPAPGLDLNAERAYINDSSGNPTNLWTETTNREFDFNHWGPYMGLDFKAAQPLNIHRFRSGVNAARLGVKVAKEDIRKKQIDASLEAQNIYHGFLFARRMYQETGKAREDFDAALEKMEELLEEEEPAISQTDLLQLKVNLYKLESGYNLAKKEMQRAAGGAKFFLNLPDSSSFTPADTAFTKIDWPLPSQDSLKKIALRFHPDLQRLNLGLKAKNELLQVSKGEMGPDIFLFGGLKYTKTWSSKRLGESDAFINDPLNDLEGVFGVAVRQRLNIWSKFQDYRKAKLEVKELERKEVYAIRGVLLFVIEACLNLEEASENVSSALRSLRASEAWLKGAAMAYDLDPSQAKKMIDPYRNTLNLRRDYYQAIYEYNMAFGKVLKSVGWTLSDYQQYILGSQQRKLP